MKIKSDVKEAKNEIMTFILRADTMNDIMMGINVLKHIRAVGETLEYNQEKISRK